MSENELDPAAIMAARSDDLPHRPGSCPDCDRYRAQRIIRREARSR